MTTSTSVFLMINALATALASQVIIKLVLVARLSFIAQTTPIPYNYQADWFTNALGILFESRLRDKSISQHNSPSHD